MKENEFNVISNALAVSALLVMNIIGVVIILSSYFQFKVEVLNNTISRNVLLSTLLISVYGYFKHRNRHKCIIKKYESYCKKHKKTMDYISVIYVFVTIILFIGAIIYGRGHYVG